MLFPTSFCINCRFSLLPFPLLCGVKWNNAREKICFPSLCFACGWGCSSADILLRAAEAIKLCALEAAFWRRRKENWKAYDAASREEGRLGRTTQSRGSFPRKREETLSWLLRQVAVRMHLRKTTLDRPYLSFPLYYFLRVRSSFSGIPSYVQQSRKLGQWWHHGYHDYGIRGDDTYGVFVREMWEMGQQFSLCLWSTSMSVCGRCYYNSTVYWRNGTKFYLYWLSVLYTVPNKCTSIVYSRWYISFCFAK